MTSTSSTSEGIVLLDATDSSLTVSWPPAPTTTGTEQSYALQYRVDGDGEEWETLSEGLKSTQARKRNLSDGGEGKGFYFRFKPVDGGSDGETEWTEHAEPFALLSSSQQSSRMDPPKVAASGENAAIVRWGSHAEAKGYELQMRLSAGGAPWKIIAPCLKGTEVRKKNLTGIKNGGGGAGGYQFRVKPILSENDDSVAFSSPSDTIVPPTLSAGMKTFFSDLEDDELILSAGGRGKPLSLGDALAGKDIVLLYASAHWCGPCRQFTPQLVSWYNQVKSGGKVEVVFLSADHDERGFLQYYSSMPWLAVPFDSEAREGLMGKSRVSGIPRLCVLDGRTGRVLEDNAVGKPMDVARWRRLAAGAK